MRTNTAVALLLAALAFVAPRVAAADHAVPLDTVDITTDSVVGKKLLSKAHHHHSRQLENNNNGYSTAWMEEYSIKFTGCTSFPQFERDEGEGMRSQILAKFKLCKTSGCGSCWKGAGDYVVEMRDFIEAYNEVQAEANEAACETQQETCEASCEYQDDDNCEYACLVEAGMEYCGGNSGDGGVNMDELSECRALNENDNGNYNGNYQVYYAGVYCKGTKVYAGVFSDSMCTKHAKSSIYYDYTGYSLPTDALVTNKCLSCSGASNYNNNNNDGNNNNDYNQVLESCTDLYDDAAKCERKVSDKSYRDTSSCDFIQNTLPRVNKATTGGVRTSVVLAWVFGISCLALIGYIGYKHYKDNKYNVDLSSMGFGGGNSGSTPDKYEKNDIKVRKGWFS